MTYFTNGMESNRIESNGQVRLKLIYNFYLSIIPVFSFRNNDNVRTDGTAGTDYTADIIPITLS